MALDDVVMITLPAPLEVPQPRAPRWRCRRPGVWACWWLGRHYATARRERGGWTLTIHPGDTGRKPERFTGWRTMAELRRQFDEPYERGETWTLRPVKP